MLCCAGLIGGMVVGQYLGGPWTFVAPAAGFGIGLLVDMKLMKGHHGAHHSAGSPEKKEADPVRGVKIEEKSPRQQIQPMGKA
jgi:hypothetical protein